MDYRGSGGFMDTSFDGSSSSANGHTRVNILSCLSIENFFFIDNILLSL